MTPRDQQKSRLYAAERKSGLHIPYDEQMKTALSLDDCQKIVDKVTKSPWWVRNFRVIQHVTKHTPNIHVVPGKGGGHAYTDWRQISLGIWGRQMVLVLHEIAHIACYDRYRDKVAPHGSEFAGIYLELVKRFVGRSEYEQLRLAFLRGDVSVISCKDHRKPKSTYRPYIKSEQGASI